MAAKTRTRAKARAFIDRELQPFVDGSLNLEESEQLREAILSRAGATLEQDRHALRVEILSRVDQLRDEYWERLTPAERAAKKVRDAKALRSYAVEQERALHGDVAAYWLERYGESLCGYLSSFAVRISRPAIDTWRLADADFEILAPLRALLVEQVRNRRALLRHNLHGRSESYLDLKKAAVRARKDRLRSRYGGSAMLERELAEYERATGALLRTIKRMQALAWTPARKSRTRVADDDLAKSAGWVAEWIRARHTGPSGQLDGNTSWPDVALALEFYGWDLRRLSRDPRDRGKALQLAAKRHCERSAMREQI